MACLQDRSTQTMVLLFLRKKVILLKSSTFQNWLDQVFHVSARHSTIGREFNGGTAAFMAMVYIIPVSTAMYAAAQVNQTAAAVAIALVTCLASIAMGFIANLPISLSTGMGLNAFAVFSICLGMGYSYDLVMLCTLIEGIIFMVLTFTGVRTKLTVALPHNLKMFIGGGIGFFLMYIGWQNTHFIVNDDSTLTTMVSFRQNFSTVGITAMLAVIGLMITVILTVRKSKAAIIIGILVTWGLGMLCQALGIYVPDIEAGYYSLYPQFSFTNPFAVGNIFIQFNDVAFTWSMLGDVVIITCTLFYSDFFDTIGTCMTCIEKIKAQMLAEIAELRNTEDRVTVVTMERELKVIESEDTNKRALAVDAGGTIVGALARCTTITSFVESGAAIESGARTGLSTVVTGLWFFLAIFFASIFTSVPGFATGPALVVVGASMLITALRQIDFSAEHLYELFPGIICVAATCLSYNIANGMAAGIISYVLVALCTKHRKEVSPILYCVAVLLLAKFYFL